MKLFYAVSAVIIAAIVTNNILLIRFVAPLYPEVLQVETHLIGTVDALRNALLYVEGLAFCGLNFWYLADLVKERRRDA
jgi:hypothetical protein